MTASSSPEAVSALEPASRLDLVVADVVIA
jgi:hypothetical protein